MKVVILITLLFALFESNQATDGKPRAPGKFSLYRFNVTSKMALLIM